MWFTTRKIDQRIVIAGNIYVSCFRVDRSEVKIRVTAPFEILILREELTETPRKESETTQGEEQPTHRTLSLTRKIGGDGIVIAGNITVLVIWATRARVKFGVERPEGVTVYREETVRQTVAN